MTTGHSAITDRRQVTIKRLNGTVTWTVDEFDSGTVMLTTAAVGGAVHVAAHFDAEQWTQFQQLIAGGER